MAKTLIDLQKNVVVFTLSFLDLSSLFKFSVTCKKGNSLFNEETLWRLLCLRDHGEERMEEGIGCWKENYKSHIQWEVVGVGEKYKISEDARILTTISEGIVIGKTKRPLSKNKIHKCNSQ